VTKFALTLSITLLLAPSAAGQETASPAPSASFELQGDAETAGTLELYLSDDGLRGFLRLLPHDVVSPIYPLWTAIPANLNEPGTEIVLGAWSSTPRPEQTETHRSIWVVTLDEDGFNEAWRGSAMARPLLDFRVVDLDHIEGDEILTRERLREACYLAAYRWNGFGFDGLGSVAVSCDEVHFCHPAPSPEPGVCRDRQPVELVLSSGQLFLGE